MHAVVEVVIYNLNAKNFNGSYFLCNENLGWASPPTTSSRKKIIASVASEVLDSTLHGSEYSRLTALCIQW